MSVTMDTQFVLNWYWAADDASLCYYLQCQRYLRFVFALQFNSLSLLIWNFIYKSLF